MAPPAPSDTATGLYWPPAARQMAVPLLIHWACAIAGERRSAMVSSSRERMARPPSGDARRRQPRNCEGKRDTRPTFAGVDDQAGDRRYSEGSRVDGV